MRGLFGIAAILLLAWAISVDRFRVPVGVLLQFALALLFLKFPPAGTLASCMSGAVVGMLL